MNARQIPAPCFTHTQDLKFDQRRTGRVIHPVGLPIVGTFTNNGIEWASDRILLVHADRVPDTVDRMPAPAPAIEMRRILSSPSRPPAPTAGLAPLYAALLTDLFDFESAADGIWRIVDDGEVIGYIQGLATGGMSPHHVTERFHAIAEHLPHGMNPWDRYETAWNIEQTISDFDRPRTELQAAS